MVGEGLAESPQRTLMALGCHPAPAQIFVAAAAERNLEETGVLSMVKCRALCVRNGRGQL
jgi:hypothetical protein